MANNDDFFKGRKPAAVLKHAVLTAYAYPFFSMIGHRHNGPMWLIDGYAGPGKYAEDATGRQVNGSPVMALELARKQRALTPSREVRCVFIESKHAYFVALQENVKPFIDDGIYAELSEGEVVDRLPAVWAKVAGNPVLTFIDPFGVSAVSKRQMTDLLLARDRRNPSEVLVNINVEAVSRHGGCLEWGPDREPAVKASVAYGEGIELSDTFFGGGWWRRKFLEARDRRGDANRAAMDVIDEYRAIIKAETGAFSIAVPIRRSPTGPTLFHFTLFYRHDAGGYKFADAAAIGQAKWREAFRQKDLEDARTAEAEEPTLFGLSLVEAASDAEAATREQALFENAVSHIEANIGRMLAPLAPGQGFQAGANIVELLGDYLSLAGERALREAWNRQIKAGSVRKRATSPRELWKHQIVKQ